jgi:hypothetical protein
MPFTSARVLAQHFLTNVPTIKEILRRKRGSKRFLRTGSDFLAPAQKVVRFEASPEMLGKLHESEKNHFEGIATGDESWFQYSDSSDF